MVCCVPMFCFVLIIHFWFYLVLFLFFCKKVQVPHVNPQYPVEYIYEYMNLECRSLYS